MISHESNASAPHASDTSSTFSGDGRPDEIPPDGYVSKGAVAEYFDVTTRTVENWMADRRIPFVRIGGTVRFRLSDVVDHVDRRYTVRSADDGRRVTGQIGQIANQASPSSRVTISR